MFEKLLDFIFPRFCEFCGAKGSYLCEDCSGSCFKYYQNQACHVCKEIVVGGFVHDACKGRSLLAGVLVCVQYDDNAKKFLKQLKYHLHAKFADNIGKMMRNQLQQSGLEYEKLIPVPLHRRKKWKRGFNQAELLARVIDPVATLPGLQRTRNTITQVGLDKKQRQQNLVGAFANNSSLESGAVVLIDDVMTTGTTLEECAKVLRGSGVEQIWGLVWARGA